MSDPFSREFVGDSKFSDEALGQLDIESSKIQADNEKLSEQMQAERERPVDISPDAPEASKKPVQPSEEESPQKADKAKTFQEGVENVIDQVKGVVESSPVKTLTELGKSPAVGTIDFIRDTINLIPNVNIPKIRKFESDYAEASRELASFLIPSLALGAGGKALGTAAAAAKPVTVGKWVAGQDALVKLFGRTGMELGTGVFVDYTNSSSQEGDNLSGTLRKMFPKTYGWISDDWATLDSDSPDVKRDKSVREGVGVGMGAAFLEAAGAFVRGVTGVWKQTKFIAGPDSVQSLIDDLNVLANKSLIPEDVFSAAVKSQDEAKDEIGNYMASVATKADLDSPMPIPGIHETNDYASNVRTVDPGGIQQAALDAVKINNNEGTSWGRLANPVSEAARKFGLNAEELTKRSVVKMLAKQIKDGGKWSAELSGTGRFVSFEEHDAMGQRLYEILVDPRMEPGMMKELLDNFKSQIDDFGSKKEVIGNVAYNGVMKAMRFYLDEFANMNLNKASAYFSTINAGQISDMAEGARQMEGTEAVQHAQQMILDRLEYLMVEKGLASYNAGKTLNLMNTWKRFSNDPAKMAAAGQNALPDTEEAFRHIVSRAKNSVASLKYMAKERPNYLMPLMLAWEMTDGNIDTLAKLHNFVTQSLPAIQKGFVDFQPEIPNVIMRGINSTVYNNILTQTATPIKAAVGNSVLELAKPVSIFAGAAIAGDMRTIKRAVYQYKAAFDTFGKAVNHMGFIFKKASLEPTSVSYMMREDMVAKNEAQMDVLFSFANAAQKEGNDGPMVLYNMAETLLDLEQHPVLRFGANAMAARDGFTRAAFANIEARGKVYDKYVNVYGPVPSEEILRKTEQEVYDQMFDKNGMIRNKAVDFTSSELALNLDTENAKAIGTWVKNVPALRTIFMFPRTSDNMVAMMAKFGPVAGFIKDYDRIAFRGKSFTRDEMVEILKARGIELDPELGGEQVITQFNNLKAEIRGRKAIGVAGVVLAAGMLTKDRLRGNGHYDKERQRLRKKLDWAPKTYMGWDGNWYSYEFLGPIADWIALTADVMDNMDTIEAVDATTILQKATFVMGAALTERQLLAAVEPMFDVLSGNPNAAARFGGQWFSSLTTLSGLRNQLGRYFNDGNSELYGDLADAVHNRNKIFDVLDPDNALPPAYDWVDGRQIGYTENWFARMWNVSGMPFKVSGGMSEERQFLIDLEYDAMPTFSKSRKGVVYTPDQRSELFRLMGEQGVFKKNLRYIMRSTDAQKWRDELKRRRAAGEKHDERDFMNLYNRIDDALEEAKKAAEDAMEDRDLIQQMEFQDAYNQIDSEQGLTPAFPLQNR